MKKYLKDIPLGLTPTDDLIMFLQMIISELGRRVTIDSIATDGASDDEK